ncbi:MAG: DUF262 domain-containing protein [Pseudolabrys sp.]|nr:DUF262 domain-containing protein [Pseudolabrys sp.]
MSEMRAAPSFYSDPHVQFLSQLLEEINSGLIQVPRFQRPLVWDWDRRRELLVSIRDGIPIGAIMVWRTAHATIECYRQLGPHFLSLPPEGTTRQYLLDGVQRLSTLYGALHRPVRTAPVDLFEIEEVDEVFDDGAGAISRDFEVFYDLTTKEFVIREDAEDDARLMPLHLVFNSVALLRFQRELSGPDSEHLIEASDEIARSFRDYKIPIIPITTDDVDMATRTFQRINSQGARMSEAHMVHALTWSDHFDLRRKFSELRRELLAPVGWAELDEDPILKACKAAFGLDVYKTNAQELSDKLRVRRAVVQEVGYSLRRAAEFLWSRCGVPSPDLVPYSLQVVILAEAFRLSPDPDNNLQELIISWFWMTTYGELFAGMSGDRVRVVLGDMREMLRTGRPKWTWQRPFEVKPLRQTFDFRAARAKAFAFRLAAIQDQLGPDREGSQILADAGRKGLVQILPWSKGQRDTYASPGNRFLVHPAYAAAFREALLAGLIDEPLRRKHAIPDEAMGALMAGDFPAFVDLRHRHIGELERRFVQPLVSQFIDGGI